ncbi:TPA: hypothetical protein ACMU2U_001448 [Clostridioides difficile]|nr:hypothetical protein [Clostridioides difficile]MCH4299877.1 hypothetical protein [Clostridioides difficile]MCI4304710.1 hypothetical protein [Clostridioides difficile]MCM4101607.1 hypothetical protein [Clostridioides difficile]MDE3445475.1 hypothetical protein [Clostridioides difficile]
MKNKNINLRKNHLEEEKSILGKIYMNLKKPFKFIFNKIRVIIDDFLHDPIVRLSFLIATLILMICFLKFSWSELENKYEERYQGNFQLDFNIENEIVENIKDNKPVDFKKIIDIDFDKVYICSSYLIVKEKVEDVSFISYIEEKSDEGKEDNSLNILSFNIFNKDKEDLDSKSPYNDKDYNYLVFMNENNKVVKFVPLNKNYEILDTTFKEYKNENTIFEFEAKETGEKTIYKLK